MAGIGGKISSGIKRELGSYPQGSMQVVIHRSCPQCFWHLRRHGVRIEQELPLIGAYVAVVSRRMLPILAEKGYISYIEHDPKVEMRMDVAQTTILSNAFKNETGLSGKGITIACIDTGISAHPDFIQPVNRIEAFVDMVSGETEPYDDNGHGTFCMGCACGNGGQSAGEYAGIASEAGIVMIKALNAEGSAAMSDILKAMQWVSDNAAKYRIRVLSLSLGIEPSELQGTRDTLASAAEALWSQGVAVIAAAGNSGPGEGTINSPGTAGSIITVGAANDRAGGDISVASFSSRSRPGEGKPDLLAPGVNLVSDSADGGYTSMSGTSMSTPIIAGCAALYIQKDETITPDSLKKLMLERALSIGEKPHIQGMGIVQMLP